MKRTLLFGADVVPTESNFAAFCSGDAAALLGDALLSRWLAADARALDLECVLFDGDAPIHKNGPALKAPEDCAAGIAPLKPNYAVLANNHILDHGEAGLSRTIALLRGAGVWTLGAGETLFEAAKPRILTVGGTRVGLYACAEHEFSIATETSAGANPFDALETFDHVRALKSDCDVLVVLYHGGREHYPYPTPLLQKRLRKLVSSGADLVLCQHGHCVGCFERYQSGVIVYGQGNFLFDAPDGEPCWDEGLLVELTLDANKAVDFIPLARVPGGVRLAEGEAAKKTLDGFFARSEQIKAPGFVEQAFAEYAKKTAQKTAAVLLGDSLLLRGVNALTGRRPLGRLYKKRARLALINHLECESLREVLAEALKRV